MGEFSLTHWLVIAVIGIVFFGPKRLPQLGQSLGESIRGFKKALNDHHENVPPESPIKRETIQAQATDIEHTSSTTTSTSNKETTRS